MLNKQTRIQRTSFGLGSNSGDSSVCNKQGKTPNWLAAGSIKRGQLCKTKRDRNRFSNRKIEIEIVESKRNSIGNEQAPPHHRHVGRTGKLYVDIMAYHFCNNSQFNLGSRSATLGLCSTACKLRFINYAQIFSNWSHLLNYLPHRLGMSNGSAPVRHPRLLSQLLSTFFWGQLGSSRLRCGFTLKVIFVVATGALLLKLFSQLRKSIRLCCCCCCCSGNRVVCSIADFRTHLRKSKSQEFVVACVAGLGYD